MAFPADALTVRVQIALGADLTADPSTWTWTDITSYVEMEPAGITITRGRQDRWTRAGASSATLTLNNADGRFARLNPFGAYYGQLARNTPLRIQVDPGTGYQTRFTGYVAKWPPSWSRVTTDHKVTVTASGIMRRLGKSSTLHSPLRRSMEGVAPGDYVPHAYWPMEDGGDATRFASALPGGTSITPNGAVAITGDATLSGSQPLPVFSPGANFSAAVPAYTDTGQWVMQLFEIFGSSGTTTADLRTSSATTPTMRVQLNMSTLTLTVDLLNGDGTSVYSTPWTLSSTFSGRWVTVSFAQTYNAGAPFYTIAVRVVGVAGASVFSWGDALGGATRYGRLTGFKVTPSTATSDVPLGQLAAYTDPAFSPATDEIVNARAATGWPGELADDRITRLCREEQVPVTISGTSTATMGAQPVASLLDALRQCEDVDLGALHESTDGKLRYLCNSARYNAATSLTLNYTASEIHPPFAVEDDDSRLVNHVTASRTDGSSATSVDQDSIDAEGEYKLPHTANTETDDQLDNIADWLRRLGTVDEYRIPAVTIELHSNPTLVTSWLACDVGSEVLLDNLPSPLPDSSGQIIEGYTEHLREKEWSATLSCSPASPYDVGVYGSDATVSRYDSASSELAAAATSSATSLLVSTGMVDGVHDPVLWVTGSSAPTFPLDVRVSGLVYAVSAIASAVTDTFSRTVGDGWGTATSGQSWSTSGGAASDYSVTGGTTGRIATTLTGASTDYATLLDLTSTDVDVYLSVTLPVVPTGDVFRVWLFGRGTDSNSCYTARLEFQTSGSVAFRVSKLVAGAETLIADGGTIGTHSAGNTWRARLQVLSSTIRGKAWKTSGSEPSGWMASGTDTSLTTGTKIGARVLRGSGNTNGATDVDFDNLEVVNPQAFTVTRLATDKALSAGEPVHVHPQARYAL